MWTSSKDRWSILYGLLGSHWRMERNLMTRKRISCGHSISSSIDEEKKIRHWSDFVESKIIHNKAMEIQIYFNPDRYLHSFYFTSVQFFLHLTKKWIFEVPLGIQLIENFWDYDYSMSFARPFRSPSYWSWIPSDCCLLSRTHWISILYQDKSIDRRVEFSRILIRNRNSVIMLRIGRNVNGNARRPEPDR